MIQFIIICHLQKARAFCGASTELLKLPVFSGKVRIFYMSVLGQLILRDYAESFGKEFFFSVAADSQARTHTHFQTQIRTLGSL